MKRGEKYTALVLASAIFAGVTGCGSGDGQASTATLYEVTVERGPVLHSVVVDGAGNRAQEIGDGRYGFEKAPTYPLYAAGGYIDLNRDGRLSAGDINNSLLLIAPAGKAATMVSTVCVRNETRAWLKERYGLDDEAIDNETPEKNRTIAAISDEIYAYCIQNGMTDPSSLTLTQMQSLEGAIASRIEQYRNALETTAQLEAELIADLGLATLGAEDVSNIQMVGNDNSGAVNATAGIGPSDLNVTQKYALAYMWNEEKLAKDIYLALDALTPHQTLYNIATRSETQHEASVETLVQKYDINITNLENYEVRYSESELRALAPGEYGVSEVQELYDALYAKGSQSLQDALEVGCMVEVTDVEDLDRYIETAGDAVDLVMVFSNLRSGSYNHYWAFDNALKTLGVSEGCCTLGENYCKTPEEYPVSGGTPNGGNGYRGGR